MAAGHRAGLSAKEIISHSPSARGRDESDDDMLRRISHVNLQQRGITSLVRDAWSQNAGVTVRIPVLALQDGIGSCHNLRTLYAYDNQIEEVSTEVVMLQRLSHLYLQNNPITRLASLDKASKLQKLYVGGEQACLPKQRT